jgi:hypothetical protein
METIEGNKLIAEFMGGEIRKGRKVETVMMDGVNGPFVSERVSDLKYHTSWEWLMPVVEKIEILSASIYWAFSVEIRKNFCAVYCHEKGKQDGMIYQTPYGTNPKSKIVAVWDAVIAFIQWYNKQK